MTSENATRKFPRRLLAAMAFGVLAIATTTASAVDVVIFKDGFTIQGRRFKEQKTINDGENGITVNIPAAKGFDIVEDGAKWILFSLHQKQVGKAIDNVKGDPENKEYNREVRLKSGNPLPFGNFTAADFDKNWKRNIDVKTGGGNFQIISQVIASIGPKRVAIASTSHRWYPYFDTREFSPQFLRKMLSTHPSLEEKDGVPDVGKRLDIATFMKSAGYIDFAKSEIEATKKAIPGEWPKEQAARLDKLQTEIGNAESKLIVDELELAIRSGRYVAADIAVRALDVKRADADAINRFTLLKAQIEIVQPKFEKGQRLLRESLDELSNAKDVVPLLAAFGSITQPAVFKAKSEDNLLLCQAGEQVYSELHPDSIGRIDFFVGLAESAERRRKAGQSPMDKPEELVAMAVSGWLMGKNGAEKTVASATRFWQWRELLLSYQNEVILNSRRALYAKMQKLSKPVTPDVLAQLISSLPPPKPENLAAPSGTLVPPSRVVANGVYRRTTGAIPETSSGVEYMIRLPAEYHHGRQYPVLIAMSHHTTPAEQLVSMLAADANRNGYIIAAPVWANNFDKPYDWVGDQHFKVTATLRSLLRHYRVDNNRVFLFGFGEGANFAMDVGASHPDLFAGVCAMGPNPKMQGMFMDYWRNCQKLPMYISIGAIAGNSFENVRRLFEFCMPQGFPAIATVYRGRGLEWFAGEVPIMFDWMSRKERVRGTASLRLNNFKMEAWQTMRHQDNRFYWVGTDSIAKGNLLENSPTKNFIPAEIEANILQGNSIRIRTRGLKNVIIWLERDMIDWTKPVLVSINSQQPNGYKPKVIVPDMEFMLEQLHQHGDRGMLFLNKLEFPAIP